MELAFNELSQVPVLDDKYKANERMVLLSKTVAEARKRGFRNIRTHFSASEIKLTCNYTVHNWLFDKEFSFEHRSIFYDMFVQPFIKEGDEEIEEKYIEAYYFFEDAQNNIGKQECLGLASAFLNETLAISLQNNPAWLKNILKITVEKECVEEIADVHHVFSKECFHTSTIAGFIESISTLSLAETQMLPDNKPIHLAEHHGKQELGDLCDRLKHNPQVTEMRSMEWCRGKCNDFIRKVHTDGVVEIVLYKTDRKYALWVQTTGRNLRETKAIAEILTEKYS